MRRNLRALPTVARLTRALEAMVSQADANGHGVVVGVAQQHPEHGHDVALAVGTAAQQLVQVERAGAPGLGGVINFAASPRMAHNNSAGGGFQQRETRLMCKVRGEGVGMLARPALLWLR